MSKVEFKCPQCQKSVLGECEDGPALLCPCCHRDVLKTHSIKVKSIERMYLGLWILASLAVGNYIDEVLNRGTCGYLPICPFFALFVGYGIGKLINYISSSKKHIEVRNWLNQHPVLIVSFISVLLLMISPTGISNIKCSNFHGLIPGNLYYGKYGLRLISIITLLLPVISIASLILCLHKKFNIFRPMVLKTVIFVLGIYIFLWFYVKPPPSRDIIWQIRCLTSIERNLQSFYSDGISVRMITHRQILDLDPILSTPTPTYLSGEKAPEGIIPVYAEGCNYSDLNNPTKPILVSWQQGWSYCRAVLYGDGHVERFYGHFKSVDDLLQAIKDRKERGIW